MAKKTIYFVRHGETAMNQKHRHQGPAEPLTEVGDNQAREVAKELRQYGVEAIIASPYTRTHETAAIIGEALDLPIETDDSLVEFRRPDCLYGGSHFSLRSLWYLVRLFINQENNNWQYDHAENMFDVRNRIIDTQNLLESRSEERIAVVSHALYIDMFVQSVCADRPLRLREFIGGLLGAQRLPNCGVVTFIVDDSAPDENTCHWFLVEEQTDNYYLRQR